MILSSYYPPRLFVAIGLSILLHGCLFIFIQFYKPHRQLIPEERKILVHLISSPAVNADELTQVTESTEASETSEVTEPSEVIELSEVTELSEVIELSEVTEPSEETGPSVVTEADMQAETVQPTGISQRTGNDFIENSIDSELSIVPLEDLNPRGVLALPSYPDRARKLGFEGTVILELTISRNGKVINAEVLEATAPEILIESCITTVLRKWRFVPSGREIVTRKTFRFRLN